MAVTIKDYSSLYGIKSHIISNLAPKYFDMDSTDDTNVGLFGLITETLGTNVEDAFFATTMLFKEQFPVTAENPDSIYKMAALYQMDDLFATPATMAFHILVAQDDVISHSTLNGDFYTLYIDSDMVIKIEDKEYKLDYDIEVNSKKTSSGWIHSAYYLMDYTNDISKITSPYIQTRVHTHSENGKKYVLMTVNLHQVTKTITTDTILTNDKINIVSKEYSFNDQLAGFDIFYRETSNDTWTQMTTVMANSNTFYKTPFCFYKFLDTNKLHITFSNNDAYFVPAYNSELKICIYTSIGSEGNFTKYSGEDITISGVSTKYDSNKGLIFLGTVRDGSTGGNDAKTVEELRNDVIKAWSTAKVFSTSNDLTLYFNSLEIADKNDVLIIKQRDDALMRLFSVYALFRDDEKSILPTNTLDLFILPTEIDASYVQTNRYVLDAGKIYRYKDGSLSAAMQDHTLTLNSDLDTYEANDFIYVNPFLTVLGLDPAMVGFYLNTIDSTVPLSAGYVNSDSFNQFIVNSVSIARDAIHGSKSYKLTMELVPTSELPSDAFTAVTEDMIIPESARTYTNPTDGLVYIDNDILRAVMFIGDNKDWFVDFRLAGHTTEAYILTATITTNDYVSLSNKLEITTGMRSMIDGSDANDGDDGTVVLIDCYNTSLSVYTYIKYDDSYTNSLHELSELPEYSVFTKTNEYHTGDDDSADFIVPMTEINSTMTYKQVTGTDGAVTLQYELDSVPLIKANFLKMTSGFDTFLERFNEIYAYINDCLSVLTNNFDIDLKFFNTYGKCRYFYIINNDNTKTLMDKTNISLHFGMKLNSSTAVESLTDSIKAYIKEYVESSTVSLVSDPVLYVSNLITELKNTYQVIDYIVFKGINDYGEAVQRLESEVSSKNLLEDTFDTAGVVPEFLNIDARYTNTVKSNQVIIDVL